MDINEINVDVNEIGNQAVKVVNFPTSGPVIWFDYPGILGVTRSSDPDPERRPNLRFPSAPLTWTCHFDRLCLDHVMNAAGLLKVEYDKNLLQNKTCSVIWAAHPKSNANLFFQLRSHQRFNHIPGSRNLTRKDSLIKTLKAHALLVSKKLKQTHDFQSLFPFVPPTFRFPEDMEKFKYHLNRNSSTEFYILKPAASTKGSGIKIIPRKLLPKFFKRNKLADKKIVFQSYLHKPYLIKGKKIDLRLFVVVTSFHPLRVYLYPKGIVRFCSKEYTLPTAKDLNTVVSSLGSNARAHITNVAKNASAETWSLDKLFLQLAQKHGEEAVATLYAKIKDIVVKTCIAGCSSAKKDSFNLGARFIKNEGACFELLGFDILIDYELEPWLLEVNLSPSLSTKPADPQGPITPLGPAPASDSLVLKTMLLCDIMYLVGVPYTEAIHKESFFGDRLAADSPDQPQSMVSKFSNKLKLDTWRKYTHISMGTKKSYRTERLLSLSDLAEEDKLMLDKGCEELHRKGHFERVFPPTPNTKKNRKLHEDYLDFMVDDEGDLNQIVKDYEEMAYTELFNATVLH